MSFDTNLPIEKAHRTKSTPIDLQAVRAKLQQGGPQVWRSLEEVAETPEFQEYLHREFPEQRVRVARSGRPPRLPEVDERVDGARRRHGVHGAAGGIDRSLRPAARGRNPRQAAVLRDGHDARRRRVGIARGKPRGPADEDRGQPRSSGEPRRHRSVRAGFDSHALRSGSVADDPAARRDSSVERGDRRGARRIVGASRHQGRRPPHPHRDGGVADARGADPADAHAASRREVDPVGAGESRQRARRRAFGVRAVRRAALRPDPRRRHRVARRGFPRVGRRVQPALHAAVRDAAPRGRQRRQPESPLRGGVEPHGDRRPRRQPVAAQVEPDRRLRARVGRGRGRGRHQRHGAGGQRSVCRRGGEGPRRASRPRRGDRRRCAAARGARDRARDQRRARRARDVSADARNRADGTARRAARAGGRHQRRPGADAGDHRRVEPGAQRARRPQVRRGDPEGRAAHSLGAVLRRDRDASATGTSRPRTISRRGATRARSTARCRSCSR